jgi:hypothetical protein
MIDHLDVISQLHQGYKKINVLTFVGCEVT